MPGRSVGAGLIWKRGAEGEWEPDAEDWMRQAGRRATIHTGTTGIFSLTSWYRCRGEARRDRLWRGSRQS